MKPSPQPKLFIETLKAAETNSFQPGKDSSRCSWGCCFCWFDGCRDFWMNLKTKTNEENKKRKAKRRSANQIRKEFSRGPDPAREVESDTKECWRLGDVFFGAPKNSSEDWIIFVACTRTRSLTTEKVIFQGGQAPN